MLSGILQGKYDQKIPFNFPRYSFDFVQDTVSLCLGSQSNIATFLLFFYRRKSMEVESRNQGFNAGMTYILPFWSGFRLPFLSKS